MYSVIFYNTATVPKNVKKHEDFEKWYDNLDGSNLIKIEAALGKIENEGLVTNVKSLEGGLYEKKWKTVIRLYFAIITDEDDKKTLLLLGSGKGREQKKAINKSRRLLGDFNVVVENIKFNPNKKEEI